MHRAVFAALFIASAAHAQSEAIFGRGRPPAFQEEDLDRRFLRSRFQRALAQGTQDANCADVMAGLLLVLAEAAPYIHKRDANIYFDENLWGAAGTELSGSRFSAQRYIHAMIRRVLLDRKLPQEWLRTAEAINGKSTIDLGKLRFLADGLQPIDSFAFTLPLLEQRFDEEVKKANSISARTAMAKFRDNYLDRDVAWGGLTLVDIIADKGGPKHRGGPPVYRAIVRFQHSEAPRDVMDKFLGKPAATGINITARLSENQYAPIEKMTKGSRVIIRGRFWDMNPSLTELELRDALIFQDRDWGQGAPFPGPTAVNLCPIAINELTGSGAPQPGGFAR